MVRNPSRRSQGGDVEGTEKTDVVLGSPIDVAAASFEPGYDLDETLDAGYVTKADLKRGFCSYGIAVGDESPQGKRRER